MTIAVLLVLAGIVLLVFGGDMLVRGASDIALRFHVAPAVIGLTVVAAGTSMPELVVSLGAVLTASPGLSIGNVVGSNIFNISAVLGVAALIMPLRIRGNTVRLEWPIMALAAYVLYLLARDGLIDRPEGLFLFLGLVAFIAYAVSVASPGASSDYDPAPVMGNELPSPSDLHPSWKVDVLRVIAGVALLAGGAYVLIEGATDIALRLGISDTIIGLTVVAAGTSLPELASSAMAAYRGKNDIAVSNVIGSNILNVLCIGGITSLAVPIAVPDEIITRDSLWMLGLSFALFPLMRTGFSLNRIEGFLLVSTFGVYLTTLILTL